MGRDRTTPGSSLPARPPNVWRADPRGAIPSLRRPLTPGCPVRSRVRGRSRPRGASISIRGSGPRSHRTVRAQRDARCSTRPRSGAARHRRRPGHRRMPAAPRACAALVPATSRRVEDGVRCRGAHRWGTQDPLAGKPRVLRSRLGAAQDLLWAVVVMGRVAAAGSAGAADRAGARERVKAAPAARVPAAAAAAALAPARGARSRSSPSWSSSDPPPGLGGRFSGPLLVGVQRCRARTRSSCAFDIFERPSIPRSFASS
jgi:hypothetical protein